MARRKVCVNMNKLKCQTSEWTFSEFRYKCNRQTAAAKWFCRFGEIATLMNKLHVNEMLGAFNYQLEVKQLCLISSQMAFFFKIWVNQKTLRSCCWGSSAALCQDPLCSGSPCRWASSRTLWTFQANPTWTCWRSRSVNCPTTWGTCGSSPASRTAACTSEGRSLKATKPSLQVGAEKEVHRSARVAKTHRIYNSATMTQTGCGEFCSPGLSSAAGPNSPLHSCLTPMTAGCRRWTGGVPSSDGKYQKENADRVAAMRISPDLRDHRVTKS